MGGGAVTTITYNGTIAGISDWVPAVPAFDRAGLFGPAGHNIEHDHFWVSGTTSTICSECSIPITAATLEIGTRPNGQNPHIDFPFGSLSIGPIPQIFGLGIGDGNGNSFY